MVYAAAELLQTFDAGTFPFVAVQRVHSIRSAFEHTAEEKAAILAAEHEDFDKENKFALENSVAQAEQADAASEKKFAESMKAVLEAEGQDQHNEQLHQQGIASEIALIEKLKAVRARLSEADNQFSNVIGEKFKDLAFTMQCKKELQLGATGEAEFRTQLPSIQVPGVGTVGLQLLYGRRGANCLNQATGPVPLGSGASTQSMLPTSPGMGDVAAATVATLSMYGGRRRRRLMMDTASFFPEAQLRSR